MFFSAKVPGDLEQPEGGHVGQDDRGVHAGQPHHLLQRYPDAVLLPPPAPTQQAREVGEARAAAIRARHGGSIDNGCLGRRQPVLEGRAAAAGVRTLT